MIPSQVSAVRVFLRFLQSHSIAAEAVTPEDVTSYLESRLAEFQRKHKRHPRHVSRWRYQRTGPIRRYLQLVRGQWPPEKPIVGELAVFRRQVCTGYGHWLTDLHGLSQETLQKNSHAAGVFLQWLGDHASPNSLRTLTIADIDAFLAWRNQGLRRATRCGVVNCLRSFLRFLRAEGLIDRDLAIAVSRPILYRNENIPSAFTDEQVKQLQDCTRNDPTLLGLRDYAMLLLVVTYGLRAGEVVRLKLEDINWRRDQLRIGEAMEVERQHLLPQATESFELAEISFPKVDGKSCVKVRTNWYSTPVKPGIHVQVRLLPAYVEVWQERKLVARHERSFARYEQVLDLEHYLDVLLRKPGALAGSRPLQQCRERGHWPESFDQLCRVCNAARASRPGREA